MLSPVPELRDSTRLHESNYIDDCTFHQFATYIHSVRDPVHNRLTLVGDLVCLMLIIVRIISQWFGTRWAFIFWSPDPLNVWICELLMYSIQYVDNCLRFLLSVVLIDRQRLIDWLIDFFAYIMLTYSTELYRDSHYFHTFIHELHFIQFYF